MEFTFPGWSLSVKQRDRGAERCAAGAASGAAADDLLGDLQDLSGDEGDPQASYSDLDEPAAAPMAPPAASPPAQPGAAAPPRGPPGSALPVEVLLLVLGRPGVTVRDLCSAMNVCVDWRAAVAGSEGLWLGPLRAALAAGAAASAHTPGQPCNNNHHQQQQQEQQQQQPALLSQQQQQQDKAQQQRHGPDRQQREEPAVGTGAGAAQQVGSPLAHQVRLQIRRAPPPPPWLLPRGLQPSDPLLHLKAWVSISSAASKFGCLRKGFEYVADSFAAVWLAVAGAAAARRAAAEPATAGGCGGGSGSGGGGGSGAEGEGPQAARGPRNSGGSGGPAAAPRRITHVDQLWDEVAGGERLAVDDRFNARAVQRMAGKLASHDWQLLYSGVCALWEAKASEIALDLRRSLERRGARLPSGRAAPPAGPASPGGAGGPAPPYPVAAGGEGDAGPWPAGRALMGGVLAEMERCMEGASSRFVAEIDVLTAACGQGPRPDAGVWLCGQLLSHWDVFRRALDLFVPRCGPLGARVEQARQDMLAGPAPRGSGGAAAPLTIPHLLNRGLLTFRSTVLLAYGVRRPVQAALAWLGARAKESGGEMPPADALLLDRAQKMLTELDVYDDASQAAAAHTHEKFRASFGALLLRDRMQERHRLRER